MKLFIIKKSIFERPYIDKKTGEQKIFEKRSLFVSFKETEIYEKIVASLIKKGADQSKIDSFIKAGTYNDQPSYSFGLGSSNFTFDAVDKFGTLDANVVFDVNEKGYIEAKIQVLGRKEMVNSYEPLSGAVEGWTGGNEPTATSVNPEEKKEPELPSEEPFDNLPF